MLQLPPGLDQSACVYDLSDLAWHDPSLFAPGQQQCQLSAKNSGKTLPKQLSAPTTHKPLQKQEGSAGSSYSRALSTVLSGDELASFRGSETSLIGLMVAHPVVDLPEHSLQDQLQSFQLPTAQLCRPDGASRAPNSRSSSPTASSRSSRTTSWTVASSTASSTSSLQRQSHKNGPTRRQLFSFIAAVVALGLSGPSFQDRILQPMLAVQQGELLTAQQLNPADLRAQQGEFLHRQLGQQARSNLELAASFDIFAP